MASPDGALPAESEQPRRSPAARNIMFAIVVAILLGLFLPPLVNVNRYRNDIANSIGNAVGHPATVGSVELRLLPQPGFDLHNVEVSDDPSINPEYLLHADQVTAYLRLSSLWRGRLEIARLSLTDPSLNVVRSDDGRWNLQSLLSRTTQTSTAPTAQAHPENARKRFPYIEATGGRINFKFGLEKKAFTFTEADFALWLESENTWNMRFEARPYRVDTHVTDTGSVKMDGSFRRNSQLRYTPVKFTADWRGGQLGQVTKLLTGRDLGWRGGTTLNVTASGSPANLKLVSDLRVEDFRRYDIFSGGAMRLSAHCTTDYIAAEEKFTSLDCAGPVGSGRLELAGTVQRLRAPFFDLDFTGKNVPLKSAMALVRHAKRDLPEDLSANGTTDFAFTARKALDANAKTLWSGGGSTQALILHSQALGPDLEVGSLTYVIAPEMPPPPAHRRVAQPAQPQPQEIDQFRLAVAPFTLALGAAKPAAVNAVITGAGFTATIAGDTDIARTLQVSRALGIDTPKVAAKGDANVNLTLAGRWTGFEAPQVTGSAQFKNVQADVPGVIETVLLNSGSAAIGAQELRFENLNANFPKGPKLTGSVAIPRNCTAGPCAVQFEVHADELSPERLNQLLNPKLRSRPWYNFFMPHPAGDNNPLASFDGDGRFSVDRWKMGDVAATHLNGAIKIDAEHVTVSDLRADLLGGQVTGDWLADFTGGQPIFNGKGKLVHASLAQISVAMQDPWATGNMDLSYELKMTGMNLAALKNSASGIGDFAVHDGSLRRMGLEGKSTALKVNRLEGTVELRDGNFIINDAKLQSGSAVYTVQGNATWNQQINFKLTDNQHVFALTGTLAHPEVKQAPATEAKLSK